jgi:hypothetical protein
MEWEKISKSHPKAFERFLQWLTGLDEGIEVLSTICFEGDEWESTYHYFKDMYLEDPECPFRQRCLYEFFDENDIRVFPTNEKHRYGYQILHRTGERAMTSIRTSYNNAKRTRIEAEVTAFTRAFGILEQKLAS